MSYLNDPSQIPHVDASPAGRPYAALSPHLPGMQVMAGFGQTRRFEGTLPDLSSYFNHNQGPYHPGRSNITFQLPGPEQTPIGSFNFDLEIPTIPGGSAGDVDQYVGVLSTAVNTATGSASLGSGTINGSLWSATITRIRTTLDSSDNPSMSQTSLGARALLVPNAHTQSNNQIPGKTDIAGTSLAAKITDPTVVVPKTGLVVNAVPLTLGGDGTPNLFLGFATIPFLNTDCSS